MISSSAVWDALVSIFSAPSLFGPGMVSKGTYDVLERSSGSCMVIDDLGIQSDVDAFGTREHWDKFQLEAYVKDLNDAAAVKARVVRAMDLIVATLEDNPTVNGTAVDVGKITITYNPETGISSGTTRFHYAHCEALFRQFAE